MLKHANVRKYRPCHAFPALRAHEVRQTRVIDPRVRVGTRASRFCKATGASEGMMESYKWLSCKCFVKA